MGAPQNKIGDSKIKTSGGMEIDKIIGPFAYVYSQTSKNIRQKFFQTLNHWYNVEPNLLQRLSVLVDKLHNASLVIDDVQDNSELRRGQPAAHLVFGEALAINAANYVYFEVLKDVLKLKSVGAVEIFTDQMLSLHVAQGMELYWRDRPDFKFRDIDGYKICDELDFSAQIPTEEDYENVIVKKTSGLFVLACKLMKLYSKEHGKDTVRLAELIGLCFQIRDDLMNLISSEYKDAKGFCEDISEGKLSFPVIHALNKNSYSKEQRQKLWKILRMKTTDIEMKEEALAILKESGALKYTEDLLIKLKSEIDAEIKKLGGNPKLESMLKMFWG